MLNINSQKLNNKNDNKNKIYARFIFNCFYSLIIGFKRLIRILKIIDISMKRAYN